MDEALQSPLSGTLTASSSGGTFSDLSSTTDHPVVLDPTSIPFVVTKTLSKRYYKGLPSQPPLIATTKPFPPKEPAGPEAYSVLKNLKELGDHPLAGIWESELADRLRLLLNKANVNWTSIDALRIIEAGQSSGPAIIWIGVEFGALSFKEGSVVAFSCQALINDNGICNCYVEIRESRVKRQAGNRFLDPIPFPDPTFTARDPYTATLGIPISTMSRPWAEGTGGFYISAGGDDKNIYLVTARHVVLPLEIDHNETYERKNSGMAREDVLILGTSGFDEKLADIDYHIRGRESAIMDATERIELIKGQDPKSITRRERAEQELKEAGIGLEELKALRHEIATYWKAKEDRIIGELIWAPPIILSTEPGQYTQDLAVIKIDTGKLNANNYLGNTINIGEKYTRQQFMDKVYLHHTSSTSFKFPPSRLVTLRDQVPESELLKLPMLDANEEGCLVVFKNDATTGTTIGRASNVSSFTRQYFPGQYKESREWPIVPTDKTSDPFSRVGDSGSCVADAFKRFGGMVIAGTGATDDCDVTYATPIFFIMKVLHNSKRFKHAHLNPVLA